jgi:hypothetical protein
MPDPFFFSPLAISALFSLPPEVFAGHRSTKAYKVEDETGACCRQMTKSLSPIKEVYN